MSLFQKTGHYTCHLYKPYIGFYMLIIVLEYNRLTEKPIKNVVCYLSAKIKRLRAKSHDPCPCIY